MSTDPCSSICRCRARSDLPQSARDTSLLAQKRNVTNLVESAMEIDNILPGWRTLCQVICEIGHKWTDDQFEAALERNLRTFYFDLAFTTMKEAEATVQRLAEVAENYRHRINVPVVTSLLIGVQDRDRQIGMFANADRREIFLKPGARFIVTADRRLLLSGTRHSVYCNCKGTLAHLTPNTRIYIGATVVLRIQHIVRQSLICSVEVGGPIRPLSYVRMPMSTSDSVLNVEEVEDIDFAIRHNALAVVVKHPKNLQFHESIVKCINTNTTAPLHIMAMTKTSEVRTPQKEMFISTHYDGIIHSFHHNVCPTLLHEPIEPTTFEMDMVQRLFDLQKPFYMLAHRDKEDNIYLPTIHEKYIEVPHYFADGFVLPTRDDSHCHSLDQFRTYLRQEQGHQNEIAIDKLVNNPLVDRTRSGRRTLFRNAALSSYSLRAQAIFMTTRTGRSAIEMAQFRPACEVFAVTERMRLNMCLCKSMRPTLSGTMKVDVPAKKMDPNSWLLHQRILFLNLIVRNLRRRLLLRTDRIIVLSKSGPSVNYLDTVYSCTLDEFLQQSRQYFGLSPDEMALDSFSCNVCCGSGDNATSNEL